MATIAVFLSDPTITPRLNAALQRERHSAVPCDAAELQALSDIKPDLAILDARLQWTLCRPLFQQLLKLGCPVLFATENRAMVSHLRALYPGAADVLALPFSRRSLAEKLKSLLGDAQTPRTLSVDEQERVAWLDGQRVALTAQELALLLALMESPDAPLSREQLLRKAWGYQSMGETRTVDVHVQRLRKKLGEELIETVYKCGYRLKMA